MRRGTVAQGEQQPAQHPAPLHVLRCVKARLSAASHATRILPAAPRARPAGYAGIASQVVLPLVRKQPSLWMWPCVALAVIVALAVCIALLWDAQESVALQVSVHLPDTPSAQTFTLTQTHTCCPFAQFVGVACNVACCWVVCVAEGLAAGAPATRCSWRARSYIRACCHRPAPGEAQEAKGRRSAQRNNGQPRKKNHRFVRAHTRPLFLHLQATARLRVLGAASVVASHLLRGVCTAQASVALVQASFSDLPPVPGGPSLTDVVLAAAPAMPVEVGSQG